MTEMGRAWEHGPGADLTAQEQAHREWEHEPGGSENLEWVPVPIEAREPEPLADGVQDES